MWLGRRAPSPVNSDGRQLRRWQWSWCRRYLLFWYITCRHFKIKRYKLVFSAYNLHFSGANLFFLLFRLGELRSGQYANRIRCAGRFQQTVRSFQGQLQSCSWNTGKYNTRLGLCRFARPRDPPAVNRIEPSRHSNACASAALVVLLFELFHQNQQEYP